MLQMRVLRHRAAKYFAHIHTAGKWQGQDSAWACCLPFSHAGGCSPPRLERHEADGEKVMEATDNCRGPGIIPNKGDTCSSLLSHLSPHRRGEIVQVLGTATLPSPLCRPLMVLYCRTPAPAKSCGIFLPAPKSLRMGGLLPRHMHSFLEQLFLAFSLSG